MKLGTATWSEGASERTALVAELPSDPGRVVDLNRLEHLRLAKLGEGWAERVAGALVPSSLRQLLEGGPRAIQRARQVVAYAEKWAQARQPARSPWRPGPTRSGCWPACPGPLALRRWDGSPLDRLAVQGPSATLASQPVPTLALVGMHGEHPAGCCLAVEHARGVVLGAWLDLDLDWEGALELSLGGQRRRLPLDAWRGLVLPPPARRRKCCWRRRRTCAWATGRPGMEIHLACRPSRPLP